MVRYRFKAILLGLIFCFVRVLLHSPDKASSFGLAASETLANYAENRFKLINTCPTNKLNK